MIRTKSFSIQLPASSLILLALALNSGCVTHKTTPQSNESPVPLLEKKPEKSAASKDFSFSKDEGIKLYNQLSNEIDDLSADDREIRQKLLAKKQQNTLEEAVLYLLSVQSILHPLDHRQTFQESELDSSGSGKAAAKKSMLSFETLEEESSFNYSKALKENPYLKDRQEIARLTLKAIMVEGAAMSKTSQNLRNLISGKADSWQKLAQEFQLGTNSAAAVTAMAPPVTNIASDASPKLIGSSKDPAQAFQQAQSLSDRGNYQQAIAELETIGAEATEFNQAQERIVTLSNLGVKDYRTKAAQSFQSAMAAYDQPSKVQYLNTAKEQLTEALNKYPKSAERGTIEANLDVIERELQKNK